MALRFFHDLQCRSGLGDRLLDLWAAVAIARLHDPHASILATWHRGLRFASFSGTYDARGFAIPGCQFIDSPVEGAVPVPTAYSPTCLNPVGLVALPGGIVQIILRAGTIWANSPPDWLYLDLAHYGLNPRIPIAQVRASYRAAARSTMPGRTLARLLPAHLAGWIGVHVRRGDKLVAQEGPYDMSEPTWRQIEHDTTACLEWMAAAGWPLLICSDEIAYRDGLVDYLRRRGARVGVTDAAMLTGDCEGGAALLDFFALSRCALIVQMTKYSTFSIAAALAGGKPLLNFYRDATGAGHRLAQWRSVLAPI